MAERNLWREAYRLARLTPASDSANLTWLRAYPFPLGIDAIRAAWTGKHGDALKWGIRARVQMHRSGLNRGYTLHRCARPSIPR